MSSIFSSFFALKSPSSPRVCSKMMHRASQRNSNETKQF